ncbi:helix-turn-helix transcriptional regulator [bacterium]|nr:helix-turn-helix transcriptional regulator [bacterium]
MKTNSAYTLVVLKQYIFYHFYMDFEKEIYIKLGKNIKKYRLENNLSQEKLSELLNANPKFVGHVERVERYISLKKLIQISKILNVSLENLFNFSEII